MDLFIIENKERKYSKAITAKTKISILHLVFALYSFVSV